MGATTKNISKWKVRLDFYKKSANVSTMKSTLNFWNRKSYTMALTTLELDNIPYVNSDDVMSITVADDELDSVIDILHGDGIHDFSCDAYQPDEDDEGDQFRTDAEADADALASAGFGTDED